MGDESPYAHNSKSMIGFVPSAQQFKICQFNNIELWMTVMSAVESADQI